MARILLRRRISIALHLIGAFFQNSWDIDQEQRAGSDSRENVCYRFSVVNADDAEKPRQNNGKRNQQNHFAQKRQKQGDFRLSQSHKGGLTTHLKAKDKHTEHIDGHTSLYQRNQLRIVREHTPKESRETDDQ